MLCQNMSNFHNKYKSDGRNILSKHKRVAPSLKSSLHNCCDRQDTVVDSYEISLNQMTFTFLHRFIFTTKTFSTLLRRYIVRSRNCLLFASIWVYPGFFFFFVCSVFIHIFNFAVLGCVILYFVCLRHVFCMPCCQCLWIVYS